MDPARYQRLRDLVFAAADLPPEARRDRLLAAAEGDAALVDEALAMLATRGVRTGAVTPGAAPGLASRVPAGSLLGRYRVGEELGRGGMGVVYEAVDVASGEPVAVKVLLPHLLAVKEVRERFVREARLGRDIVHEHVVRTLDVGTTEVGGVAVHWFAMERVRGRTLRRLLAEMGTVPEGLLREIARQAASGLAAIHEAGVVHRDVKPENVLLTDDRRVRIMDLGVAKAPAGVGALTVEGQFIGSMRYASPEQAAGREVGPAADLYALGVVLFELATGAPPFEDDDLVALLLAHADRAAPRAAERNPALSEWMTEVIATLLCKRPEDRFPSAQALAAAVAEGEPGAWWRQRLAARGRGRRPSALPPTPAPVTRLVGRDRERDEALAAWRRAVGGHGGALWVEGEAGVGKTRLLEEVVRVASKEGGAVLRAGFLAAGAGVGLRDALAAHLALRSVSSSGVVADLARRLGVAAEVAQALHAFLARRPAPEAGPLPDAAADVLLGRLLRSFAADEPVLFVVEDVHHADADALRRLVALARAAEAHRVLVLATARPGVDAAASAALALLPATTRLDLERLPGAAVAELVAEVVRDPAVADRLSAAIAPRADGVPFFVLEMLRDLERRGLLVRRGEVASLAPGALSHLETPRPLRDLLRGRLAAVAPGDRAVLDTAAVEGVEFDPGLVARARGASRLEVLEALGRLERSHELVRNGPTTCRFDHALLREVVYEDLPAALRAALHERLAVALADEGGAPSPALAGERLARAVAHRMLGEAPQGARAHLIDAARHFEASGQRERAFSLYRRALDVPGLLDDADAFRAAVYAARIAGNLGRHAESLSLFDEAERRVGPADDPRRAGHVHLGRGYQLLAAGEFEAAGEQARRAEGAFARAGLGTLRLQASGLVGKASWCLGRHAEARATQESVLREAEAQRDAVATVHARVDLAILLQESGERSEAEALQRRAVEEFVGLGDVHNETIARLGLANTVLTAGRRAEAARLYDALLAQVRRLAFVHIEATVWTNLGELRTRLGDLEGARTAFRTCIDLARETQERPVEAYAHHGLGVVEHYVGDRAEARRRLAAAETIRRGIRHGPGLGDTLLVLATLDLEDGDVAAAAARFSEAIVHAEAAHDVATATLARLHRARLPGGDLADARARFLANASRLGPDARLEGRLWLWRLASPRDDQDLRAAVEILDDLLAGSPPSAHEAMLSRVPLYRDVAQARPSIGGPT